MNRRGFFWSAIAVVVTTSYMARAEGPAVDIVVGTDAPRLERFAADELAGQLKVHFGARVTIGDKVPAKTGHLILLGSPQTNPAVKTWAGQHWRKLTDQGHLLHSVTYEGRKGLLVGGGSPVATLWAVYELGHHFGVRYLTRGDMPPADLPVLRLDGIDMLLEPTFRVRAVQVMGASPIGFEAWSLADQKRLLRQFAKLKFNQVILPLHPWQPFTPLEIAGAKKKNAVLFSGKSFPLDGETAGRTAFPSEAREFVNPDFGDRTTLQDRTRAGETLIRGILDTAHELGMKAILVGSIDEFASEYPGKLEPSDFRRALSTIYPKADEIVLFSPQGLEQRVSTWRRPRLERTSDRRAQLDPWLSARRLSEDRMLWQRALPGTKVVVVPLEGDGILPQLATRSVHNLLKKVRQVGQDGFCVQLAVPADQDPCLHYLARASCDAGVNTRAAYADYVNAIWGEGVAERLIRGFDKVEEAVNLIDAGDPTFAELNDAVVMKHYRAKKPAPAWLAKARDLYSEAMDEMYRANQRARKVSHEPIFYHCKRLEFAVSYLSALETLYLAAQARDKGNAKEQLENLEKSTEAMFNGLAALGEVARDASNLGVLAVLNAYGYRPLRAELERVEKSAKGK